MESESCEIRKVYLRAILIPKRWGERLVIRKSFYKRVELRRAWIKRKQRAVVTKQELRWKRRAAKLERKPASGKKEAPVFIAENPPEEKPSEEARPEKTEIPRTLFPE